MIVFSLILGLIIGSFLNVVALRYNTGRTLSGRSGCFTCGKKLCWSELIPVISYLCQRGRCRSCSSKISIQYPLVELGTGLLFSLIYLRIGLQLGSLILAWFVASVLMVVIIYDFRHKIIPDLFVFLFILAGLFSPIFFGGPIIVNLIATILGGLATASPLFLLWVISRGRWLGFGDVKLALGMGLFLGITGGLSALILAFWSGALVGLSLIIWGKTRLWRKEKYYTMKSEVPFAPFLILGFWSVFLFSINVLVFWQI